jgi:hypothetical protein
MANRSRSASPKRKAASPKRKAASPERKTFIDKMVEKRSYDNTMKWVFMIAIIAIYITCLVLYLINYTDVQAAVDTHFDFTSSFLYKPWFVIILLTLVMLGLLYIVRCVKCFSIPIFVLMVTFLVFFTLMFIFIYNNVPTKQSSTPQIMAVVAFIALVILTIMIVPYAKYPLYSLVCLAPAYFLTIVGIVLGGVMNREYIV